jgi:hypothetical protein
MPRHNYAKLLHVIVTDHCMCLVCKRTCTHPNSVCHVYVQGTNVVHTVHVLTLCMQFQAFADPVVMKTFRRVVLVICMYHVHTLYIHCTHHSMYTYTLYIHCLYFTYFVHTWYIHCTYCSIVYIHCTYNVCT